MTAAESPPSRGNRALNTRSPRSQADRATNAEDHGAGCTLSAAGDTGFWQGAVREPDDPFRGGLHEAFLADEMLTVDLLYGGRECGHRTISRFIVTGEDDDQWRSGVVRHWALDCIDPRVTYHDACQPRPRGGALLRAIGRQVRVADTVRGSGSGDVRALGASAHPIDELIAREAGLEQALLVDVTVGVDRVWQVVLGLLDHVASTYSG